MMKAVLSKPVHESYKRYRKQLITQIILPMVIAGLLLVALIVLIIFATFRENGDVARWAAISTIWIVIPIMIASLIFFLVLGGLVYLMKRLLNITPTYTGLAQDFVHKLAIRIRLAADAIVKPVIFVDGIGASINRLLGRK
jgi:heme/copper-type cytochrome/quinol oxidase subunit 2